MESGERDNSSHRVRSIDQFVWLVKLYQALLEVSQRPFHQHLVLFVVVQQVIPQRLLTHKHLETEIYKYYVIFVRLWNIIK